MSASKDKKPILKRKTKKSEDISIDENGRTEDFNDVVEELKEASDSIGIEMEEGERITYGSSFSPQDGDLGDESEDIGDLPEELRKIGHRYDSTIPIGGAPPDDLDELEEGIDIVDADDAGLGYGENDYTEDSEDDEYNSRP